MGTVLILLRRPPASGPRRLKADMDVLLLGEGQHLLKALLASEARLLETAEWCPQEMLADLVDPNIAGFDRSGGAMCRGEIVGPDRTGQPVFDRIHLGQHALLLLPAENRKHRPEDLFARDPHRLRDIREHR